MHHPLQDSISTTLPCVQIHTETHTHIHKNKSFLKKDFRVLYRSAPCEMMPKESTRQLPFGRSHISITALVLGALIKGTRVMWAQETPYHDIHVLPLWLVSTINLKASRIFWKTGLWACLMFTGVERCAHYGGGAPFARQGSYIHEEEINSTVFISLWSSLSMWCDRPPWLPPGPGTKIHPLSIQLLCQGFSAPQ